MSQRLLDNAHPKTECPPRSGSLRNRALHQQGQKQGRTKIYGEGEGPPYLFVPLESMWDVRNAAQTCQEREGRVTLAGIAGVLGVPPHRLEAKVAHWRWLYRRHDWFEGWLLERRSAPADFVVATLPMIRRCRAAWDYMAHCREAGVRETSYYRWLKNRLIPDLRWLLWLYGVQAPNDAFVIKPELQRLRKEKTRDRILANAKVGKTTLGRWEASPVFREALGEALRVAAEGGSLAELANRYPPWRQLKPRTQKCMWRYAEAASLTACCARAGILEKKHFSNLMSEAGRKGVREDLGRYLDGTERSERRGFRAGRLVAGLIAPNLFAPTGVLERDLDDPEPGGMFAFRKFAGEEAARQNVWALRRDLPRFDDWFLDWVIPWGRHDQRIALPKVSAARQNGHFKGNGKPAATEGGEGEQADDKNGRSSPEPVTPPPAPRKGKGGRHRTKQTQEVYKFCFEERRKGKKDPVIMREANTHFGRIVVSDVKYVWLYAKRHAERTGRPMNRK